jgi:cyclopropane fatty-acyl-phospholipid synthase-like methyltransferase
VRNYGWLLGEGFEQERTVLEVGPGLGRNTFPLLDRGFNVTVVEPERSVRDRIKSFAGSWGIKSRLSFVEGTYQSLAEEMPSVKIDGLVSIGSLQFASTRDVASRFMENVHSRMNQGGVVLLEANNDKDEPNLVSTRERLSDGRDPFYLPSGEELLQIFQRDEWGILYYDPDVKILMPKGDIKLFEDRHPGAKVTQRSKTYIIASKK